MQCASCRNEALPGKQFCAEHLHPDSTAAATSDVFASFWRRAGAAVIDYIAGMLIAVVVGFVSGPFGSASLAELLAVVAFFVYYAGFESSALQATPGKLAMDIKVTTLEGERIGFGRALGRQVGKLVSGLILYVGYLMALFTSHRQTLHDKIAGTYVVRRAYRGAQVAQAGPAPPTPGGTIAVVIGLLVFALLFLIGMLAAISVPAYQDYTIRSQVAEGLSVASGYKAVVMEAHAAGQPFTGINSQAPGLPQSPDSSYLDAIDVANGAITLTFGNQAHANIAGRTLTLVPATDGSGDILWLCGRAAVPAGLTPSIDPGAALTTLDNKYLPTRCRGP